MYNLFGEFRSLIQPKTERKRYLRRKEGKATWNQTVNIIEFELIPQATVSWALYIRTN